MELEKEIVQTNFKNIWQKAIINVMYTSNWINAAHHEMLKTYELSTPQYNILRILRGQHPKPATIRLLTQRMLDKMSNASRLVERLRIKGMVERDICASDRRQVHVRITDRGLELLRRIDATMDEEAHQFENITEEEAAELSRILDKMRG
ncbi:MAG TPA: MarR family transcriptional regulator [Bacteroidetes bacterium]|nr:MarR family transcriptional regulator [Bacteroidota bacterium]